MTALRTIYLVDDDEDWRFLIKEAIASVGIEVQVVEADNGWELFNILPQEISHSILLLDVNMPVMNGIETLRVLKTNANWSTLPIILMSSADERGLTFSPKEAGATKFIQKPTFFAEYVQLISELHSVACNTM